MHVFWGFVVVALSLLAWGGQIISWLAPDLAIRLNVMEPENSVEPAYWADIRGEAPFDFITLWTMVAAGVLLILDNSIWAYFGLVGGGMYIYFAGRAIFTRAAMQRRGFRVGNPTNLKLAYALLAVWGLMGLIMIAAAVIALPTA
jgi:hypothetical protein